VTCPILYLAVSLLSLVYSLGLFPSSTPLLSTQLYLTDIVVTLSIHIHRHPLTMNVNKKFDRFKQWGRERMGSEVKTDQGEEFKMLEVEMALRQEG
jgi:hypothetical protein